MPSPRPRAMAAGMLTVNEQISHAAAMRLTAVKKVRMTSPVPNWLKRTNRNESPRIRPAQTPALRPKVCAPKSTTMKTASAPKQADGATVASSLTGLSWMSGPRTRSISCAVPATSQ